MVRGLSAVVVGLMAALMLDGCGGGGGGADPSANPSAADEPKAIKATRFLPESYAADTSNGLDNLEGLWIVLVEGTIAKGKTLVVNGSNYREDFQYWSRATARIRKDPGSNLYFLYTCSLGGARDVKTGLTNKTMTMPFYFGSTTSWINYPMALTDNGTLRNANVVKQWGWVGNSGEAMSWTLSWTLKRISNDPFAPFASVQDNKTSQNFDAGCVYEAEGSYVATQNDSERKDFRKSGLFHLSHSYPSSQLNNDIYSYSPYFELSDLKGLRQRVLAGSTVYDSLSGDLIQASSSSVGNGLTDIITAGRSSDALPAIDMTLTVSAH